jgi:spore coat polysaccharide biosynthesis predicted glycosyltransferase SpsG
MGGADAANKTLQVLDNIKDIPEKLVVWVMLGEGYTHSYQDLVDCMGEGSHEIILVKSNDSMWRILSTCSLAILSGGTTTYEAVYAGLPSINLLGNKQSQFLIQELVDRGVVLAAGQSFKEGLLASHQLLRDIYHDRVRLLTMQQNTQGLIDNLGAQRIVEEILQIASLRKTL